MKRKKFDVEAAEKRDQRQTSLHEAAHVIVARHFGCPIAYAKVWRWGKATLENRAWGGRSFYLVTGLTPFRNGVHI